MRKSLIFLSFVLLGLLFIPAGANAVKTISSNQCLLTDADVTEDNINEAITNIWDLNYCKDGTVEGVIKHLIKLQGTSAEIGTVYINYTSSDAQSSFLDSPYHHLTIKGNGIKLEFIPAQIPNVTPTLIRIVNPPFSIKFENIKFETSTENGLLFFGGDSGIPKKIEDEKNPTNIDYYSNTFKDCSFISTYTSVSSFPLITLETVYRPRIIDSIFKRTSNSETEVIKITNKAILPSFINNSIEQYPVSRFVSILNLNPDSYAVELPCGGSGCKYSNWENLVHVNDTALPKPPYIKKIEKVGSSYKATFVMETQNNVIAIYSGKASAMKLNKIFCVASGSCNAKVRTFLGIGGTDNCSKSDLPDFGLKKIECTISKNDGDTLISAQGFAAASVDTTKSSKARPLAAFAVSEPETCLDIDYCDPGDDCVNGKCKLIESIPCVVDSDCDEDGAICKDGNCELVQCGNDAGCPSGYGCVNYICELNPDCVTSEDCPEERYCNEEVCVECIFNSHCETGYACENNMCTLVSTACSANSDCPSGFRCTSGECEAIQWCQTSSNCPSGQICWNNECRTNIPCSANADCPSNYICDTSVGSCLPAADVVCSSDVDCGDGFECDTETNNCLIVGISPEPTAGSGGGCSLIIRR